MSEKEKFVKLTVDGEAYIAELERGEDGLLLDGFYRELSCESIEVVNVRRDLQDVYGVPFRMIVDEMGKCRAGWTDRINYHATATCSSYTDLIVGDVLIGKLEAVNEDGELDIVGLTDRELSHFFVSLFQTGVHVDFADCMFE